MPSTAASIFPSLLTLRPESEIQDTALFTYQTRLTLTPEQEALLSAYAELYGQVERTLFAELQAGGKADQLKSDLMQRFGLTARQFNAISINLRGKMASIQERRPGLIKEAEEKIKKLKKLITHLETQLEQRRKLHQKKRRLQRLEARLATLKADQKAGYARLCFGSKKLFHAQFDLEANGYASHEEWRRDWQNARASQFYVIGSKDETAGCQGCVMTFDGTVNTLKLRLPNALDTRYLTLTGVCFAYGQEQLSAALQREQAISYRFLRDAKGWRVFAGTQVTGPQRVSRREAGAIGVDLNADHLAVAQLDRFGNLLQVQRLDCVTYGKTSAQTKALVGDTVKKIASLAQATGKPVVIEKLDFSKRKAALEQSRPAQARMLSSFAYNLAGTQLRSACLKRGVEMVEVHPAYTSVIGAVNHASQSGISTHQGAAIAIARRGLSLSERPTLRRQATVPDRKGGHVTFELPARNRTKHVWSFWSNVRARLRVALAAPPQSGRPLGQPAPQPQTHRALRAIRGVPVESRQTNRPQHCSADVETDIPY